MKAAVRLVAAITAVVLPMRAAHAQRPATSMTRADSAWANGDRSVARALYEQVLIADSTASRAVFRLAQLEASPERALALYRRYVVLEPDDPWGHMAEGDLLSRMERFDDALIADDGARAIAPDERDVAIGRARVLDRAGRSSQAADELSAWTKMHPDDGDAWDLLGRAHMRSGRLHAARDAFLRAERLNVHGARNRRLAATSAAAPSFAPDVGSLGDSDGNRTRRLGGAFELMAGDGVRLGVGAAVVSVGSDVEEVQGTDFDVRMAAGPSPLIRITAGIGAVHYGGSPPAPTDPQTSPGPPASPGNPGGAPGNPDAGQRSWNTLRAAARVRLRTPGHGPSLDLRLDRAPLGFSPLLVQNHVERSEVRATAELPIALFRLRGTARFGRIDAANEAPNGRSTLEGALILPLGDRVMPSLQYRRAGYQRASVAGYFAPRLAETIEAGLYTEGNEDGPITLAADAGVGAQRVTPHGGVAGDWTRVWRGWGQVSLSLGPSRAWFVEVEAYDAPFALEGTGAADSWRFLSLSSGLHWAIR